MEEILDLRLHPTKTYMYIIEGAEKIRTMTISDGDVVTNAEGKTECPLISILRKNSITVDELKKWKIESIRLIEMTNDNEKILYEFDSDSIARLLQV